jgi:hypothetical protein
MVSIMPSSRLTIKLREIDEVAILEVRFLVVLRSMMDRFRWAKKTDFPCA